jgi:[citrate (pro-3S)-lyase] ligase
MYYAEQTDLSKVLNLLDKCSLSKPDGVNYTAGIYTDGGELAATGSLKGDMIQAIAVDPAHQGEDLMGKLLTHLIGVASERGLSSLHLFTKPEKAVQFQGLGFRLVASARPFAALLEWGAEGIEQYAASLSHTAKLAESKFAASHGGAMPSVVSALVMNCNPFTLGHRFLAEQASISSDIVYLLVVEEDKSLFSFKDRFEMVYRGVEDLTNVVVIPGGRYAVSSLTFPSYFTKEENLAKAHTAIDAEIFCRHIAPALKVTRRFIGTEPLSAVTAV